MSDTLYVVWNAVAGARRAAHMLEAYVMPRIRAWKEDKAPSVRVVVHETEADAGAVRLGRAIAAHGRACTCVVLGGDGTVHELLEGLFSDAQPRTISIVLVPMGTGNALYHTLMGPGTAPDPAWRLGSLESFTKAQATKPLTLMQAHPGHHLACVVVSHALHAAILRDSEALRARYPGPERFQIAAEQHLTSWVRATLTLLPDERHPVSVYDPTSRTFSRPAAYEHSSDGRVHLSGPFLYMNAMTVDRLEPSFVPAPFASPTAPAPLRRPASAMDVIVIRPTRQPSASSPDAFARDVLMPVLFQGMYQQGKHVDMQYEEQRPIVEYFRASGYIWEPARDDALARTMCVDGTIIDGGERAVVRTTAHDVHAFCA